MALEVTTEVAPAHWASYLVNGDASGLDDEEIAACDAWHETLEGYYVVSTEDDEEAFIRRWDGLLTDCITYILHRHTSRMIGARATNARPTTTGVRHAIDVDVVVTMPDGREIAGEVTLLPAEGGRPRFESWGSPDNWISGALLTVLNTLNSEHFSDACAVIEEAARAAAGV